MVNFSVTDTCVLLFYVNSTYKLNISSPWTWLSQFTSQNCYPRTSHGWSHGL